MEHGKTTPNWLYGLVGIAAVGGISLMLLATIMFASPPDRLELTSVPTSQDTQTQ